MERRLGDYYFNVFLNLIRATYMNMEKDWENVAKEAGLTHAQQHALWILQFYDYGLTLEELGNIALWNKSTTSALISRLEKKGYVKKERYLDNSRTIKIYLTEEGRRVLDKSVETKSAFEFMSLFEKFEKDDIEVLISTMKRISTMVGTWDLKDFEKFLEISSKELLGRDK